MKRTILYLFFVSNILALTSCNTENPNRVYFTIDPYDRKILVPFLLNDSIKANLFFDTGAGYSLTLDANFIEVNPTIDLGVVSGTTSPMFSWDSISPKTSIYS